MRITGGLHRSRLLGAPRGDATRPTSDRVREALFDILGSGGGVKGAHVLDLYAGTGALALEALSRGAVAATVVESARPAIDAIRGNARSLGLETRVRLVNSTVERAGSLLRQDAPFDLLFADPPYAQVASGEAPRAVSALLALPAVVAPRATLVFEHGKADEAPSVAGFALDTTRRYGDSCLSFYKREVAPSADANA